MIIDILKRDQIRCEELDAFRALIVWAKNNFQDGKYTKLRSEEEGSKDDGEKEDGRREEEEEKEKVEEERDLLFTVYFLRSEGEPIGPCTIHSLSTHPSL